MRTNLSGLMQLALERADDQAFVSALKADPQVALSQAFGVTFIPSGELADDDLEDVVGGVAWSGPGTRPGETFELMTAFLNQLRQQGLTIVGKLP